MNNALQHFHLEYQYEQPEVDKFVVKKIAAQVADLTDRAITQAIIEAARKNRVDDLYLLDEQFILDAIREKADRVKNFPLTLDELRQMVGEPVWVAELEDWGIVEVDAYPGLCKDEPFVHGRCFNYNVKKRELHCFRVKPDNKKE